MSSNSLLGIFFIVALPAQDGQSAFIGLMDFTGNNDWRWISDNATLTYTNWAANEPINSTAFNCAYINTPFSNRPIGQWFVDDCNERYFAACETERVSQNS